MSSIGAQPAIDPNVIRALVVDDDNRVRKAWRWMLMGEEFQVEYAANASEALDIVGSSRLDVVISDISMPGMDGLELLDRIKAQKPDVEVIIMTGVGTIESAVRAMRAGAFDYLTKPFNEIEECIAKVRQAARLKKLREENLALRAEADASPGSPLLDSQSPAMRPVLARVSQVARVDSNVLITGPTGAGKNVIARAIHQAGRRRKAPFIAVDCASLSAEQIESELFGHAKGSRPGAVTDKPGLFELANGGTMFLDEVGEMPDAMQSRLLRVLQEGKVRRHGSDEDSEIDVRLVSASQRDLGETLAEGFREDLYYRLKVVEIGLPGLNDRREDIPRLAYHFLRRHATKTGKELRGIEANCMELLKAHDWKGNIRELEHAIEAAMVCETTEELTAGSLPPEIREAAVNPDLPLDEPLAGQVDLDLPFREALEQADRVFRVTYLRGVMARYQSVSAAARHAEMDRANFRRLLRRYEISDYPRGGAEAEAS